MRRRRPGQSDGDEEVFDLDSGPPATTPPAAAALHPPAPARAHRTIAPEAVVAESISYARGGRAILDQVSVTARPGEALAVTGPSGSGKSSLLALLAGLERPDSGTVRRGSGPAPIGRDGLILQGYGLVGTLTAAENVETPLQADAAGRLPRREIRERAAAVLDAFGLTPAADHLIEELSGGQQQRVAVARALAVDPAVVFADELTAELDREWKDRVVDTVLDIARRGGIVVLATHDPDIAQRCDRIVQLLDGRVVGG